MTIQKQAVPINFSKGLETKTDPFQLSIGSFLNLENSVFTKGGRLTKRSGFGDLAALPEAASYATTFNGDLTVLGDSVQAYLSGSNSWVNKGAFRPLSLNVLPLIRNNTTQSQADSAVAANGFICTVYTDQNPANLATKVYKYAVADSVTGQNVIAPTVITGADATLGTPRAFLLGNYFIIIFTNLVLGTYHLKYIAISSVSLTVGAETDISTNYLPSTTVAFDAVVANNTLYIAWNRATVAGVLMTFLNPNLSQGNTIVGDATHAGTMFSVTADITPSTSVIWVSYYNLASTTGYTFAVDQALNSVRIPTLIIPSGTVLNITSVASMGVMTFFYEVSNNYSYDASIPTHFVTKNSITQLGVVGASTTLLRSVGLASKAFTVDGIIYVLTVYQSPYQSTYFLTDSNSHIVAKLAYGNAGGYLLNGLPEVTVTGSVAQVAYLFKDAIQAVNKNTNVPAGNQVAGVYSQLGINLVSFTIGEENIVSGEIGNNLNITGGFVWAYDGYSPVEQEFFLYPDSVKVTTSAVGGSIAADTYFYQVTYEWTDNQGNAFRSAPSIPVSVVTTGATSSNTINVPMLRLTYKTANPVKIVVYRWAIAQQAYYQVTSITLPILNNPTIDSVAIVDTLANSTILGNNLIYTTGGVIENIAPPATDSLTLFDDRLWLVDAENKNLLWFSKQVIDSTPVEMSDLLTVYVASNLGATGPTGPILALSAMDDKLIIFKQNAAYYINGTGPDNTGANNQYSQPTFITSMIGCSNQRSIVFQPQGLMFEFASEAGSQIWILTRDLQTQYIGSPVEELTRNARVLSSIAVPGTNQVRFNLSSGITLMYDYFYGQWGTFSNDSTSSTLYQDLHTYLGPNLEVFQETPNLYLDGSTPVLMSFKTGWINLAGLRGYERAFFFYLLGKYVTPFKFSLAIAYDYDISPSSFAIITPDNFTPTYGSAESNGQNTVYGTDTPYGGVSNILNWRIFMKKQRCSSFQIILDELYDPSFGVPAGEGFSLSGLSLVCGIKSGYKTISAAHTVGAT